MLKKAAERKTPHFTQRETETLVCEVKKTKSVLFGDLSCDKLNKNCLVQKSKRLNLQNKGPCRVKMKW